VKPSKRLFIASAAIALAACATSTQHLPTASPLVLSQCPMLTPLEDDSFGATTRKLAQVAQTYYGCRAAALGSAD
jgi:uncharacterized lipoprotein YajG